MSSDGAYIDEASLRRLHINLAAFKSEVLKSASVGLQGFGMKIVGRAKAILKENDNIATGFLRNSGRTIVNDDGSVDAGFTAEYAGDIEYGRKSGTMPDVNAIYQWLIRKRIVPRRSGESKDKEKSRRNLAYAIAKSIERNGTKDHPYLSRAYDENKEAINKYMQGMVDATVAAFDKE